MSKKHIGHDYTLNIYAEYNKDNKSLVPSSSIEQQVSDQESQISVLDSVDFSKATGSVQESGGEYSYANMIFASRSDTIGLSNRLFTHPKIGDEGSGADGTFGRSVVISGSTMFVNSRQRNDVGNHATRSMRNRQGVFVFKSASSGWAFSDAIFPSSSYYPIDSTHGPQPEHVAKSFDGHSEFVAIAAPLAAEKGVTLVYKSGSSGYSHDATIGSASFVPAYWTQSDATNNSALIYYIANGTEGIMPSVKVNNNKLVVGGFSVAIRPDASTSYTTHHRSSSLAVFSSASSGGWAFESLLSSSVVHTASSNVADYYRKGMGSRPGHFNGAIDYDGTRVAAAGQGGYDNVTWQDSNGRVSIFKSSSTGWYEEDQIDLRSAGFTGSVTSSLTPSSPDITLGSGVFAGSQEWKLYLKFGYYSCAISGNYMAASAKAYSSLSSNSPRIKNRIFIFKSSSSGWAHEVNFKSPNPGTGGDGTHVSASYADEFGYTLNFNRSVPGMLVTRSPSYRAVPGTSNSAIGRVHIYKSSSVSGWALEQNIDNAYSGSLAPVGATDYRDDYEKFGDHAGLGTEGAGDYLDAVSTGLDGPNMAIPFSSITESENDTGTTASQKRFGAIKILNGSSSFRQETITQEVTESVEVTHYVLSPNNLSPFIKTHHGPVNIRLQSGSSTPHSVDLGSSKS